MGLTSQPVTPISTPIGSSAVLARSFVRRTGPSHTDAVAAGVREPDWTAFVTVIPSATTGKDSNPRWPAD